MKNKLKNFGIIALVAIIGFSFTACGDGDDNGGSGGGIIAAYVGTAWTATSYGSTYTVTFTTKNTITVSGFGIDGEYASYNGTFTLEKNEVPMMSSFDRVYSFHNDKIRVFVMDNGSSIGVSAVAPNNSFQEDLGTFTKK